MYIEILGRLITLGTIRREWIRRHFSRFFFFRGANENESLR